MASVVKDRKGKKIKFGDIVVNSANGKRFVVDSIVMETLLNNSVGFVEKFDNLKVVGSVFNKGGKDA